MQIQNMHLDTANTRTSPKTATATQKTKRHRVLDGGEGGSLGHLRICPSRSPHKIHSGLHSFSSATHQKTKFPSFKLRQQEHSIPQTRALRWLGCHWVLLELPAQALRPAALRVHSGDTQQRFPFLEGLPHQRAKKVGGFFFFLNIP